MIPDKRKRYCISCLSPEEFDQYPVDLIRGLVLYPVAGIRYSIDVIAGSYAVNSLQQLDAKGRITLSPYYGGFRRDRRHAPDFTYPCSCQVGAVIIEAGSECPWS